MAIDAVKATYLTLDEKRGEHNFELLGMDFMIDWGFKPWLIEINTNPCLEMSCPLLSRLIPSIIENTFKYFFDNIDCVLIHFFLRLKSGQLLKNYLLEKTH